MISIGRGLLIVFFVGLSQAFCEPVVISMPDRKAEYTEDIPAYLFFKEIRITRVSVKKVSFDITLQGEMPHNIRQWVSYRVYFDVAGYEIEDPLLKMDGFQEDLNVCITQRTRESNFTVSTRELVGYRSKVWKTDVTSVRVRKDIVSFDVRSDVFSEPDTPIRLTVRSLVWRDNDSKRIDNSPIVDLPKKSSGEISSPATGAVWKRE